MPRERHRNPIQEMRRGGGNSYFGQSQRQAQECESRHGNGIWSELCDREGKYRSEEKGRKRRMIRTSDIF